MKRCPIVIKKIEPATVLVAYSSDNQEIEPVGELNEYEWNDLRIQIRDNACSGFRYYYNNKWTTIDSNGRPQTTIDADWPFPLIMEQLDNLIGY